jgi:hypothetical protein
MQREEEKTLAAVGTSQRVHNLLLHNLPRNNLPQLSRLRSSPQQEERHRHNPQRPPLQPPTEMRVVERNSRPVRLRRPRHKDPQLAVSRMLQLSRRAQRRHLRTAMAAMHRQRQPAPIRPMREPTRVLPWTRQRANLKTARQGRRQARLKWLRKRIQVRRLRMLKA